MRGARMVGVGPVHGKVMVRAVLVVTAIMLAASSMVIRYAAASASEGPDPLRFEAGEVSEFAVTLTPQDGARETFTGLPDGRERIRFDADTLITADEHGTELLVREHYTTIVEEIDEGEEVFTTTGTGIIFLFEDDAGPRGTVGENGALIAVSGRLQQTFDPDEDLITAFTLRGRAVDLCAALAG